MTKPFYKISSEKAPILVWAKNQNNPGHRIEGGSVLDASGEVVAVVEDNGPIMVEYTVYKAVVSAEDIRHRPGGPKSITFAEVVGFAYPKWVKEAASNDCHVNHYDRRAYLTGEAIMPLNMVCYRPVVVECETLPDGDFMASTEMPSVYFTDGIDRLDR